MNNNYQRVQNAIKKEHAKLGFTFHQSKMIAKDADGNVILGKDGKPVVYNTSTLVNLTDQARELIETLNDATPCWFKGCESLRKQYKEELANSSCKVCKGTIIRKYTQLARELLDADPDRVLP